MKNDPHVSIGVGLEQASQVAVGVLREHWKPIGAVWLITNVIGTISFLVLYPPWQTIDPADVVGSFRYGVYFVLYTVVSAVGFIFTVLIVQAAVSDRPRTDFGTVLDESVRFLFRYLATAFLSFLRIGLWSLAGIPVAAVLSYLFVLLTGGAQSGLGFGFLVTTPVVIMSVLAYVRFGWALYYTVITGDTPLYAMYYSQSMFLNNQRTVWILSAIVFLVPSILPVLSAFGLLGLPDGYEHVVTFISSAWTYVASVLATVVVMHAEPRDKPDVGTEEPTS